MKFIDKAWNIIDRLVMNNKPQESLVLDAVS
jgi:hypothetical protein